MREALARSESDVVSSEDIEQMPPRFVEALRLFLRHPMELAGLGLMGGLGIAILVNALFLQNASHSPFLRQQRAALAQASAQAGASVQAGTPAREALPTQDTISVLRDIQLALAERGLYDGLADGVQGPKTTAAIRSFQQHNGLAVDGQSSPELLAHIVATSPPVLSPDMSPTPALETNSDPIAALINGNPPAVAAVQPDKRILAVEKALAKTGYGPVKVDGIMATDTRNAIMRFEKDRGMPVTGQVSARFLRELAVVSGTRLQ